ncbi:ribonuclease Z [Bacillus sp. FJAT-42376]|uniref:ribonuclease Z n=1 Tax=Bacillus sp. FJAT-42376 TaxID=2014076 RepID=UPI000F5110C3|nr:ribonuclease Z [Bacillus sp. FJAT-42376]AZB43466.1 ribonuclease Z [Bacillus sp. FJAT-42376]
MNVLFLGTGAGVPSKQRNVSSLALELLEERGAVWLFDCGEGTQHQILHTSLKPRKIEKIFITHMHGDHIFGLPGLLGSRSFQGAEDPLMIYGPKGIKQFVGAALAHSQTHLRYPIEVIEGEGGIVFEDDQFIVEAILLEHGIPSYGYRITEKDKPGTLMADKLMAAGIKPGPVYQQLKEGGTAVMEDGTVLNGRDYLGPPKRGKIIAIAGDTRSCPQLGRLAENADLLVHEATFAEADEKLAHEYFHSTTIQAAALAQNYAVKQLVLTHISARYQGEQVQMLLNEARKIFANTAIAEDLLRVEMT